MFCFPVRYPLLLNRVYKKTSPKHPDRAKIKEAKHKVEKILEHINIVSTFIVTLPFQVVNIIEPYEILHAVTLM